jgi:hypothetical protein
MKAESNKSENLLKKSSGYNLFLIKVFKVCCLNDLRLLKNILPKEKFEYFNEIFDLRL